MGKIYMDSVAITTALTGVVTDVTEVITAASPIVLGVIALMASVTLGFTLVKRFTNKMK